MKTVTRKLLEILAFSLLALALALSLFFVFFDGAVFVRGGTVYRVPMLDKVVALTFDDGPSPIWTPRILDELATLDVKATFFVLGEHVERYPEIAKRIVREGHEIENHSYDHHLLLYCKPGELNREINETENAVRATTGRTTRYFRPPRAWLTGTEKARIEEMGYKVVLWSLNSKDWVTFDDKYIVRYIVGRIQPGDIILFHDGGGIFGTEGRNRDETVKTISRLVPQLRGKGYRFVTVSELVNGARGR